MHNANNDNFTVYKFLFNDIFFTRFARSFLLLRFFGFIKLLKSYWTIFSQLGSVLYQSFGLLLKEADSSVRLDKP